MPKIKNYGKTHNGWEHDFLIVSVVTNQTPQEVEHPWEVTVGYHEQHEDRAGRKNGSGSIMVDSIPAESSEDARKKAVQWMRDHPLGDITKLSPERLREIAEENHVYGDKQDKFLEFIARRFPNEGDPRYVAEWADRVSTGSAVRQADANSKEALIQSGLFDRSDFPDKR